MELLKSLIIVAVVLIYWKFVYYPYHKKDYTPISFFFIGGGLFFYGLYLFFNERVIFSEISLVYYIMLGFLITSFTLLLISIKKSKLKTDIDITLTWAKKTFPFMPYWSWMIIAFPALFFILIATYGLLGQEHIAFWGMVFIAWIFSNLKLYKKHIRRGKK